MSLFAPNPIGQTIGSRQSEAVPRAGIFRRNSSQGCFKDIAQARHVIEPRLEGFEKLLYPLRAAAIELDIITKKRFFEAFRIEEAV